MVVGGGGGEGYLQYLQVFWDILLTSFTLTYFNLDYYFVSPSQQSVGHEAFKNDVLKIPKRYFASFW